MNANTACRLAAVGWVAGALLAGGVVRADGQVIERLVIEVETQDSRFAGTDDPIQLSFGGMTFPLDTPNHDDFERGQTDVFDIPIVGSRLTYEAIRVLETLAVTKTKDSFWGGGWHLQGLRITAHVVGAPPLAVYENADIDESLDGDHLVWSTTLGEVGWNLPEPQPWPPCSSFDVDTGEPIPDADCDGIGDESDPTFDEDQPDQDGDGLPDVYEFQNGSDPLNPDSDGDGWWDGAKNLRHYLILTRIECIDEGEDVGRDELFLTSEDVRFPTSFSLDGTWPMNDGDVIHPNLIVDVRATGPGGPQNPFTTRMRLREDDFDVLEDPRFDDTYGEFAPIWEEGSVATGGPIEGSGFEYVLTFEARTVPFLDPSLLENNRDLEGDGLDERLEFQISSQAFDPAVAGYEGLADPGYRELFVEIDALGESYRLRFDAKQMVASQFFNHSISPRFDDGRMGGGQILPYDTDLDLARLRSEFKADPNVFSPDRVGHFHYGIFVDEIAGGLNGKADQPGDDFLVSRTTLVGQFSPIVLLHELGHNLRLCHTDSPGVETPIVAPVCPVPSGWPGCTHYCGVTEDDPTAMGAHMGISWAGTIGGFLVGAGGGAIAGAAIGSAFGPPGAIIGGIVGGLIGGVAGGIWGVTKSDFYQREVNFHQNGWDAADLPGSL